MLNRFTLELSGVCSTHLLEEKWLIAPSLRVGHQWLDTLTLNSLSVLNVRTKTMKGMVLELAGPAMVGKGVSLISDTGSMILVDRILNRLTSNANSYFSSILSSMNFSWTMLSTITAIRLAGLNEDHLDPKCFEVAQKGKDVAFVLGEYTRLLRERQLLDYADVVNMMTEMLCSTQDRIISPDLLVLVPMDLELSALENRLLNKLPTSSLVRLPVDEHAANTSEGPHTDSTILKWILVPEEAPASAEDGTAMIFRSMGECNEVREVLRRCLSSSWRLDEVELLHTDTDTYVPLIYETLLRTQLEPKFDTQTLPVTFAEGIPARYSRPGRALSAWIDWIRNGYPQTSLVRMIQDGLLEVSHEQDEYSFSTFARIIGQINIGFGQQNYMPSLTEKISVLESRLSKGSPYEHEHDHTGNPDHSSEFHCLAITKMIMNFVQELLDISVSQDPSQTAVLAWMAKFVQNFTRFETELDNYSRLAIMEEIRELSRWIDMEMGPVSLNLWEWASSLPSRIRVLGSGPRPGCLHVAHAMSGGHSGRKHTFIIGMDDGRFPGAGLNDPLLLDGEREKLSNDLPKASAQLRRRLENIALLLARLRGTINLGFSCLDILEDRSMFPSSVVFSAYRIISNNKLGDQREMMEWLPPPVSFAPEEPGRCLDQTEWRLSKLCAQQIPNLREILDRHFPHLSQGLTALQERASDNFTIYDGKLPNPPRELDPTNLLGPVMSANKLETIGKCPLSYFFRYVLNIQKPDDFTIDPSKWLDPLKFGNLLHEVFYHFFSELIDEGRRPQFDRDRSKLLKILEENVNHYRKICPPPSPSVFARQDRLLKQAALIFLTEEEILCTNSMPKFVEATIGMRSDRSMGLLDQVEPLSLPLLSGKTIRAPGRIDRIDQIDGLPETAFSIWDYKSGSSDKYQNQDAFQNGRIIQHALYIEIASALLKKKISHTAHVAHFGYFFPGNRSRGVRVTRLPDLVPSALEIVENLCRVVASGCFIATNDFNKDCTFCDYTMVCGDLRSVSEAAGLKLKNKANDELKPVSELRINH